MIENCKVSKHLFKKWPGEPIADTYGGKTVIDFKGQPLFAELVALHLYKQMGFDGVWVDNYRNKYRVGLPAIASPIKLPAEIEAKLSQILRINNSRKGIWDLLLWQNRKLKFVELCLSVELAQRLYGFKNIKEFSTPIFKNINLDQTIRRYLMGDGVAVLTNPRCKRGPFETI